MRPPAHAHVRLLAAVSLLGLGLAPPLSAGGYLKVLDRTGHRPSPLAGQELAEVRPIRWDDRCIPSPFRFDSSQDPIPNPLGGPVLTAAVAQGVFAQAFATWRDLPTAYSELRLTGTTPSAAPAGFDLINEITFRPPPDFNAIALTRSIVLLEDSTVASGQDLDGDGDSDAAASLASCGDADGDGDLELAPGFYRAGTILDVDILLNSEDFRFTAPAALADVNARSVDLLAIAIHESGHAQGLAHSLDNQLSPTDGTSSTMYPNIDTTDPADELALRTLGEDDIATLSAHYPEGSRASGPGALQAGDVAFALRYGFLTGEVQTTEGRPVAGASIAAEHLWTGRLAASAFSGRVQVSIDPVDNSFTFLNQSRTILDGAYRIPVPLGLYRLRIEGADGAPITDLGQLTPTEQAGASFGQLAFEEEFYNGSGEAAVEAAPGAVTPVLAIPGYTTSGLDFVLNRTALLGRFQALTSARYTDASPGTYYAVRIPGAELLAAAHGHRLDFYAAEFFTLVADASVVPLFGEALLATGSVAGSVARIDLDHPLARRAPFIGEDFDFASFYLPDAEGLGREVIAGLEDGNFADLFLVLRVPTATPFPGVNALPPLVGASRLGPLALRSYRSSDGVTFTLIPDLDFLFRLVTAER